MLIPGNATVAGIGVAHIVPTGNAGMPIKDAISHWETPFFSFPLYVPLPTTNFSNSLGINPTRCRNFRVTSQNH
jgi:hypothetical protein